MNEFSNRSLFEGEFSEWKLKTDSLGRARQEFRLGVLKKFISGKTALDLGCGIGEFTIPAAGMARRLTALDFSTTALESFRSRVDEKQSKTLSLIQADILNLPFKDSSFEVVYSFSTLYGTPDPFQALKEISRILRPEGVAIFDLGNCWSLNQILCFFSTIRTRHFSTRRMRKMIEKAELQITESHAFQILPLYGGRWVPFSSNFWRSFFARKIGEKTIDERLSSLPLLKHLAYRHFFICRRNKLSLQS